MKTKQKTTLGLPLFPSTVCTSFVSQYFGHVSALHLAMPVTALLSLTALSRGSLWSLGISHLFLQLFSDFSISSPQSFLLSLLSPRSFIPPFLSLPCLFVLTLSAVYSWFQVPLSNSWFSFLLVSESLYGPATLFSCLQSVRQRVAGERHGAVSSFCHLLWPLCAPSFFCLH